MSVDKEAIKTHDLLLASVVQLVEENQRYKKEIHSLKNIGKKNLILIEIQTGSKLSESDIVRLKDEYGRV